MVAIGRALMGKPSLLLLDEPSVGIAHRLKMEIFDAIKRIQQGGVAILMAEQDAQSALRIADRVYVLEHGHVGREGTSAELGVGRLHPAGLPRRRLRLRERFVRKVDTAARINSSDKKTCNARRTKADSYQNDSVWRPFGVADRTR